IQKMITERRYDIDWVRVIAIWLLMFYHLAIGFQPYGALIMFIQNNEFLKVLEIPMSMLSIWRIPILFFISGMGVCFAMRKRDWKAFIGERSKRILLPFVFGFLTLVPLHQMLWQSYFNQDIAYIPAPGHLWFLGNIFVYVLLLLPLFQYLKNKPDSKMSKWIRSTISSPFGLLIILAAFVAEAILVDPEMFALYALTPHGFWLGMIAFLFGYLTIYSGDAFWQMLKKIRWGLWMVTILLFLFRAFYFDLKTPNYLMGIESTFWILSIFAVGYTFLNKGSATLTYLTQASYPIYILHMLFQYLGSYFVFPLDIAPELKFIIVLIFTFVGCYFIYEIIRRINFLRPLFGLKLKSNERRIDEPIKAKYEL
ncbi:MAG: acyltransferase family protein, partial [Bacteroidota bacterium]